MGAPVLFGYSWPDPALALGDLEFPTSWKSGKCWPNLIKLGQLRHANTRLAQLHSWSLSNYSIYDSFDLVHAVGLNAMENGRNQLIGLMNKRLSKREVFFFSLLNITVAEVVLNIQVAETASGIGYAFRLPLPRDQRNE